MELTEAMAIALPQLLHAVPLLLVCLIGITLGLCNLSRHPGVSVCSISGFLLLGGLRLVGIVAWIAIVNSEPQNMAKLMQLSAIVQSLLTVPAYGLLIMAMFGWRSKRHANPSV